MPIARTLEETIFESTSFRLQHDRAYYYVETAMLADETDVFLLDDLPSIKGTRVVIPTMEVHVVSDDNIYHLSPFHVATNTVGSLQRSTPSTKVARIDFFDIPAYSTRLLEHLENLKYAVYLDDPEILFISDSIFQTAPRIQNEALQLHLNGPQEVVIAFPHDLSVYNFDIVATNVHVTMFPKADSMSYTSNGTLFVFKEQGLRRNVIKLIAQRTAVTAMVVGRRPNLQVLLLDDLSNVVNQKVVEVLRYGTSDKIRYVQTHGMLTIFTDDVVGARIVIKLDANIGRSQILITLTDYEIIDGGSTVYSSLRFAYNGEIFSVGIDEHYRLGLKNSVGQKVHPSRINVGTVTLEAKNDELVVNGDDILQSNVFETLEGYVLQLQRTRIVFTKQNSVRVDHKNNGTWDQGLYVFENNLVQMPLRLGSDRDTLSLQSDGVVFDSGALIIGGS